MRVLVVVVVPVGSVPVGLPAVQVEVASVVAAAVPQALSRLQVVFLHPHAVVAAVVAAQLRVRLVAAVVAARRDANPRGRSVKSLNSRQRPLSAESPYLVVTTRRSRFARVHQSLTSLRRST